ncbi:MAG TPA: phytanoyl-CoA dioxygenase family protein [Bacilli bacterium]
MTDVMEGLSAWPIDNALRPATKEFQDATPLLANPDELRALAKREGYLFFRGLFPQDTLSTLRRQILEILQRRQLLDPSKDFMEGIADIAAVNKLPAESVLGNGFPLDLYLEIQRLELFHQVAHEPGLLNVFHCLFQAEPFPHPKTIARVVLPHELVYTTPPHQDFIHIQGTTETWTAWFPLSDCPRELGGLSILEGSHHMGVIDVAPKNGAGGLESILCGFNMEWAAGDYHLGDVVIFNSQTVHKALPNQNSKQIRLSCDFRYQSVNDIIDPRSLEPHVPNSWEEIYTGWTDNTLKYYWKKFDLTFSEWDDSIRWQKEKIC